jgi:aspartate/methionine/tyrosine aminotransferase
MPGYYKRIQENNENPATVFDQVNAIISRCGTNDLVRLDMGDTSLQPPETGRPSSLNQSHWRDYNLYSPTSGIDELKHVLLKKLHEKNGFTGLSESNIQISCGAINALFATFKTLLDPGEEIMVLAPRWPMISGVVTQAGAVPVDLPFYIALSENQNLDISRLLEKGLTKKTKAIYLNSPNNPSGLNLSPENLDCIGRFAEKHNLWIISDEAYEDFIYDGACHTSIATIPGMSRRVISIFTFSKCLAAAGYRVGYAVADEDIIQGINKVCAQTIYNAPTDNQQLVVQALNNWDEWFPDLKNHYRKMRDIFDSEYHGKYVYPEGGFYAFIDMRDKLDEYRQPGESDSQAALNILEELIKNGVALLPGEAFAVEYTGWLRACFIAEEETRLRLGIERLNQILAQ